jgi:hypothetical protein
VSRERTNNASRQAVVHSPPPAPRPTKTSVQPWPPSSPTSSRAPPPTPSTPTTTTPTPPPGGTAVTPPSPTGPSRTRRRRRSPWRATGSRSATHPEGTRPPPSLPSSSPTAAMAALSCPHRPRCGRRGSCSASGGGDHHFPIRLLLMQLADRVACLLRYVRARVPPLRVRSESSLCYFA